MLRMPLRNSTRELRKWARVFSGHNCSTNGMATSQMKQPGTRGSAAVVFSSMSALLHFHSQDFVLQTRAAGRQRRHRGGQADVAAQGADLNHQLIALFEKSDLALRCERQQHADLVVSVMLHEA